MSTPNNLLGGSDDPENDDFQTPTPDSIPTLSATFLDRQLSFSNGCRDDGLAGEELQAAGRLWTLWMGLDLRDGADEQTARDAVALFRQQCPHADKALMVVNHAWNELKAVHDVATLAAGLRSLKSGTLNS